MGIFAAVGVLLPFPYYYWLWTNPQAWVNLCGKYKDPSKVMAYVSHFFKLLQFISLFSVSTLSWPPPLYFWPLFGFGQFLNFRSVVHCDIISNISICACNWSDPVRNSSEASIILFYFGNGNANTWYVYLAHSYMPTKIGVWELNVSKFVSSLWGWIVGYGPNSDFKFFFP